MKISAAIRIITAPISPDLSEEDTDPFQVFRMTVCHLLFQHLQQVAYNIYFLIQQLHSLVYFEVYSGCFVGWKELGLRPH